MSNGQWYYAVEGQQRGPVSWEELTSLGASRQLQPHDLVWQQGMDHWQSAGSIPGLIPPPPPGYPPTYPPPTVAPLAYASPQPYVKFAGFWIRFCAALIDGVIMFIISIVYGAAVRAALSLDPTPYFPQRGQPGTELLAAVIIFVLDLVVGWLYYALQESSVHQATLGKRAVGVQVIDLAGARISFARATGRYFAEILSALTLMIGYMMAGWTERKQALHDMIAGTYVIYTGRHE